MDCTQALDDFQFEESTKFVDGEKKQLGCLEVRGVKHAVFNGENRIGRDVGCSISINSKALSKEHAVIEIIDADNHLIYDVGSRNKTRLGKMVLQPEVRYQLGDGAKLHLADVSAIYRRLPNVPEIDDDSGSETGSESMLNVNSSVDESVIIPETPGPSQLNKKRPMTIEESPSSLSDPDGSFNFTGSKCKDNKTLDKTKIKLDVKDEGDNSIFEAETLCIDEPINTRKLDATIESCKEKDTNCNKDDYFEAETQCDEIQFKVPMGKSEGKENVTLENNTEDDIHEADTQCDISPGSLITESPKKEGSINSTEPGDKDESKIKNSEEDDDIYDAPTQCFVSDKKTDADKIDAASSCSEQTEDFTIEELSLSSVEDVNVTKTEDDLNNTLVANDETKKSNNNASNIGHTISDKQLPSETADKTEIKNKKESENKDASSKTEELKVSHNEDSLDRSLLEGDDDFFDFETTQIHVKKSDNVSEKTDVINAEQEVAQKSPVSKGSELIISAHKTDSAESTEIKDKNSNTTNLKETETVAIKNIVDSGEETDPDDIFNAPTQPVSNTEFAKPLEKKNDKSSAQDNDNSVNKTNTESIPEVKTEDITSNCKNENIKTSKNETFTVPEVPSKVNISSTKSSIDSKITKKDDIFEAPTQLIETSDAVNSPQISPVKIESKIECADHKNDNQKLSNEDDNNEDDEIYEVATQIIETTKKDNDLILKPSVKPLENTSVASGKEEESPKSRTSGNVDQDIDDDIFEACTQQVAVANVSSASLQSQSKNDASEEKHDTEDTVFETCKKDMANKSSVSSESAAKKIENLNLTKSDDKEKQITHLESDDQDDIFEAATQIVESPGKKVENSENMPESISQCINPSISDASKHTSVKDQENTLKIPIEGSNSKGTTSAKPSGDLYDDDDFCEAATQKVDTKSHVISLSNNHLEKTSKKEQEETYKDEIQIDKSDSSSSETNVSDDTDDAMTQPKSSKYYGKYKNVQQYFDNKYEKHISELKKEDKNTGMKVMSDFSFCGSSTEKSNTVDFSDVQLKKADDKSENIQNNISELPKAMKKRENDKAEDYVSKLRESDHSSENDKITDDTSDKSKKLEHGVEKLTDKSNGAPKKSDTELNVKNDTSTKEVCKTETGEEISIAKKMEDDGDETDPEELFDESNLVKVDNDNKIETIERPNNNKTNSNNPNIEDASESGGSKSPSPTLLQDNINASSDNMNASSKLTSEMEIKITDIGKENTENMDTSPQKSTEQDTDKKSHNEDDRIQETLSSPSASQKTQEDSKSDTDLDNLKTKDVTESSTKNGNELQLSEGVLDKSLHEDSDGDMLNDTQDISLPSTQEIEKAAREMETVAEPIEDIPSEEDEGSPVIASKHSHIRARRAKVRKRLSLESKDTLTATETSSGKRKRNPPGGKSSPASTDTETISSKRRRQHNESIQNDSISNGGTMVRKQRKLSDSIVEEQGEMNKSSVTVQEDHSDDTVDSSTINEENGKSEEAESAIAQKKQDSKAIMSNNREKERDEKSSLNPPRKARASRSKTEKSEENEQIKSSGISLETGKTSRRRKSTAADLPTAQERSKRKTRHSNKNEDVENVSAANSRPSRQRKMTWKVRESLKDSQGNVLPEEKTKRGRGESSGSNSQNESDNLETSSRTSRTRNSSPTKSNAKKLETEVNVVGISKTTSPRKSVGQDKLDVDSKKNQSPQVNTRTGQKRKIEESSSETPTKRSKKEAQSPLNNKVKDTNSERSTRASMRRDQSQPRNKKKATNNEQSTRLSSRRANQSLRISSAEIVATENSKSKTESPDSNTIRITRKKMEVNSPSCLKELNTSVSNVPSRQRRGQKRTNVSIDEKTEHTPAKQRKQEKNNSSPAKTGMPTGVVEPIQNSRSRTSRGKGTPQKTEAESAKPVQKARSGRALKADNDDEEEKTESVTPSRSKTSEKLPSTPQHSRSTRGRGTPQSSTQQNVSSIERRRSTPRKSKITYQVLFTGFSNAKQESIVKQLGGSVVDLPESGTVLVTDKVRRTYKFLCVMGCGKPIVSPEWLVQCQRSGHFVDPWQYLIRDHESESKFNFKLQESLELAAQTKLLKGYSVHVTPKVKPPPSEMKGIVESCGGTYLQKAPPKTWPSNSFIISCPEDKGTWAKLKKSGKPLVGPQVLLQGVLQQKLDLKSNSLV